VRQLRNAVENMVVLAGDSTTLSADDIPEEIHQSPSHDSDEPFRELAGISLAEAEKQLIRSTLAMVEGNRKQAASILGIGERTLYRKIEEYDLKE
jgi:DNA-binding NtrC family response regulator